MLFSIIVPIYKVEEYLPQCVDSILAQDFNDYELILVDDGSPDRCPEICDEYAARDSRVVVIHKENGGLSDARNAGILKARGEYLCFLDSDDYWQSAHALSLIAEKIQSINPDLISWDNSRVYLHRDGALVSKQKNRDFLEYEGLDGAETLYKLVAEGKLFVSSCLKSVRRSFLMLNNLFFKKGIKSEDIEWGIRLFTCEPAWAFLSESFYVYRINREGSITATIDYNHLKTYCQIIEDSINLVKDSQPKTKEALLSYLMYHVTICNALISRTDLEKMQRKGLHKRLKAICKEYLLKYRLNKKARLAGTVYRVLGYKGMTMVLGYYLAHRNY